MILAQVTVNGTQAEATQAHAITRGLVGAQVQFTFDSSWENLRKIVVFRADDEAYGVADVEDLAEIPWEILEHEHYTLYVGVYGNNQDGSLVIPTVWTALGAICSGTEPGEDPSGKPTEPLWQQALDLARSVHEQALAGDFDGYTPQRGVDYWTEADKAEIAGDSEGALDAILQLQQELIEGEPLEVVPSAHITDRNNPHQVTPEQIGAARESALEAVAAQRAMETLESQEHSGCYYCMVDGQMEWINPPMLPNVEYRTNARHNGQVVYKKLVDFTLTQSVGTGEGYATVDVPYATADIDKLVVWHGSFSSADGDGILAMPHLNSRGGTVTLGYITSTTVQLKSYNSTINARRYLIDLSYTKKGGRQL